MRRSRPQTFVMCPPTHFDVVYSINAWMDPSVRVDKARVLAEWSAIREAYERSGHTVHLLSPDETSPDMVFAANGFMAIGDRALLSRFRHPERAGEVPAHRRVLESSGVSITEASDFFEGEGDALLGPSVVLAGWGFRSGREAHAELAAALGARVVSLKMVDPRFYHLDTAMLVLDGSCVAIFPGAFDDTGLAALHTIFPDVVEVDEEEAVAFGLNGISDGANVFLPEGAPRLTAALEARGFSVRAFSCTELMKAGGAVKCVTGILHAPDVLSLLPAQRTEAEVLQSESV